MIWVFLGGLALVEVAMAIVARHTVRPVYPVDVDDTWETIADFYRERPDRTREVDLGNQWTSVTDPGAMFSLSWIRETGELVALRRMRHLPMAFGGGLVSALPVTGLSMVRRKTGVKVLGRVGLPEVHRLHPHRLEPEEDGLDRLTAALGCPYLPPAGAEGSGGEAPPAGDRTGPAEPPRAAEPATGERPGATVEEPAPQRRPVAERPTPVVTVVVREPATRLALGQARVPASGRTVGEVLESLGRRLGDRRRFVHRGTLAPGLAVYLGHPDRARDPDLYTDDLAFELETGDLLTLEPSAGHHLN